MSAFAAASAAVKSPLSFGGFGAALPNVSAAPSAAPAEAKGFFSSAPSTSEPVQKSLSNGFGVSSAAGSDTFSSTVTATAPAPKLTAPAPTPAATKETPPSATQQTAAQVPASSAKPTPAAVQTLVPAPAPSTAQPASQALAAKTTAGATAAPRAAAASADDDEDDLGAVLEHVKAATDSIEVQQADPSSVLYSVKDFEEIAHLPNITQIPPAVMRGIKDLGYVRPSKIQEAAIPLLLKNPVASKANPLGKPENMIFQSQAGTGKTAAYAITILSRVDPSLHEPQALIVTPVFNLCLQSKRVIERMASHTGIRIQAVYGGQMQDGVPVAPPPRYTAQVLVCTPGSLANEVKLVKARQRFDRNLIKVLVLDEADHLVDEQFLPDIKEILSKMPNMVQTILLSATFDQGLLELAEKLISRPLNRITLPQQEVCLTNVKQLFAECVDAPDHDKLSAIIAVIRSAQFGKMIIFVERRDDAMELATKLSSMGISVGALHGQFDRGLQDSILQRFRDGKDKVLVTTNILARGIDVAEVSLVVHYSLPQTQVSDERGRRCWMADCSTYVHRSGRTGRFGKRGVSLALVDQESDVDHALLREYQDYMGVPITQIHITSADIKAKIGVL